MRRDNPMMDSNEVRRFEKLVRRIDPQSRLVRVWPLEGGISARMTAFEILRPGGDLQKLVLRQPDQRVLRRNPDAAAQEFKLLGVLESAGVAAGTPIYLDESRDLFTAPFFVMGFIEGEPVYASPDRTDFLNQAARQLALIHQVSTMDLDLSFLPD